MIFVDQATRPFYLFAGIFLQNTIELQIWMVAQRDGGNFLKFLCSILFYHPSQMIQVEMSQTPEKNNNTPAITGPGDGASGFTDEKQEG